MIQPTEEIADPQASARAAHLRYVHDTQPGIRRERVAGKDNEFRYIGPTGELVTEEKILERIRRLAIPPAYTDVWICPIANGHLQATGQDARGRKQYRYHARWNQVRDQVKYERMLRFGSCLPQIRERVNHDLARRTLNRERVLATVVRLLETTRIRVGNDEYARTNHSYGLTTLQNKHVAIDGNTIHFHFRGKSGKEHRIALKDRRLARILQKCQEIRGQELFQWQDEDGARHGVGSGDVNDYLHEISGEEFTAKDFRTWSGTVLCTAFLAECGPGDSEIACKQRITDAVKQTAAQLGNTPAVCRKSYIHPEILERYQRGDLLRTLPETIREMPFESPLSGLSDLEKAVLKLLAAA